MLLATVLALSAAVLHAGWNVVLKTAGDDDRDLAMTGQFLLGGLLVVPALVFTGGPGWHVWPWLAASSLIHIVYLTALMKAYGSGDFSLAYPLARGGGALVAALGGVAFLDDHMRALAWLAIGVVLAGLLGLIRKGADAITIGWALLTAVTIGAYTLIDSHGAREADDSAAYALFLMPMIGVAVSAACLARGRGPAFVATLRTRWWNYGLAGLGGTLAYTFVLIAVQEAPVGYVTMLRESSVVIGALFGWLALDERLGGRRLVSSGVVAAGLALLVTVNL